MSWVGSGHETIEGGGQQQLIGQSHRALTSYGGRPQEVGEDSRVLRVDVMDGHTSFNGPQSKPRWLVLLVLEDTGTAVLVLERTVDFLLSKTYKVM